MKVEACLAANSQGIENDEDRFSAVPWRHREEKIESEAVQSALLELLPGRIEIVDHFLPDTTHAFGRPPKNWWPWPPALAYPAAQHEKPRTTTGLAISGTRADPSPFTSAWRRRARQKDPRNRRGCLVKAIQDKFYTVPVGIGLAHISTP